MNCKSESCQYTAQVYERLNKMEQADKEFFEDLFMQLVNVKTDLEVTELILKGEWPSSEEYFKANGWVRANSIT